MKQHLPATCVYRFKNYCGNELVRIPDREAASCSGSEYTAAQVELPLGGATAVGGSACATWYGVKCSNRVALTSSAEPGVVMPVVKQVSEDEWLLEAASDDSSHCKTASDKTASDTVAEDAS